jgi:hypothetical protein
MFVVVIRDEAKGEQIAVHRQKNLRNLLHKLLGKTGAKKAKWASKRADTFIKAHYNVDMSASQIAAELTVSRRRQITKNMVIKRANKLGRGQPKISTSPSATLSHAK